MFRQLLFSRKLRAENAELRKRIEEQDFEIQSLKWRIELHSNINKANIEAINKLRSEIEQHKAGVEVKE